MLYVILSLILTWSNIQCLSSQLVNILLFWNLNFEVIVVLICRILILVTSVQTLKMHFFEFEHLSFTMVGQNVQGQAAQNKNPLLRFVTLLENGQEHSKKWMCKKGGICFRGNCQKAYHHLLGDSGNGVRACICWHEQKAEIALAYETHNF